MINRFKEYFQFSKRELNGLLVLCILLVIILIFPYIYSLFNPPETYDYSEFKKEVEAFKAAQEKSARNPPNRYDTVEEPKRQKAELFPFNPNGLSAKDWMRLGLSERQVKVIKNYEAKGGKFFHKEDLQRIYSLRAEDYSRLEPFIVIPEPAVRHFKKFEKRSFEKIKPELKVIEVNSADSAALESLRGIGPAFASRIIRYRNRLGGFYKKDQLKEVYGLDSAFFENFQSQIQVNPEHINKIDINAASFEALRGHPYLSYKQINAILNYRKQHGAFQSLSDLKAIAIVNDELLQKMAPYLSFGSLK